jgi:hypothetical protein
MDVNTNDSSSKLDENIIKKNLKNLSLHPMKQCHVYVELDIHNMSINDITVIENYPNLMYLNISNNTIWDINILNSLPYLIKLNANNNKITTCLPYTYVKSDQENETRTSLLSHIDLSNNKIHEILNMSFHPFIQELNLSNNMITSTLGFSSLKHLKVRIYDTKLINIYLHNTI